MDVRAIEHPIDRKGLWVPAFGARADLAAVTCPATVDINSSIGSEEWIVRLSVLISSVCSAHCRRARWLPVVVRNA